MARLLSRRLGDAGGLAGSVEWTVLQIRVLSKPVAFTPTLLTGFWETHCGAHPGRQFEWLKREVSLAWLIEGPGIALTTPGVTAG